MSVYNEERYLQEAIESILRQTFTDFEFIIVDDGSTDKSLDIIKGYDDARIKIIKNDVNIGLTKSLNKALLIAVGEYVARQDADDVSLSCRFEEQINFYENNPELVLLGTSFYRMNETGKIISEKTSYEHDVMPHDSFMFNRIIINNLGGYNELFKYAQDCELLLRVSKHYKVMTLQLPLICIRHREKTISSSKTINQTLYALLAKKIVINNFDCDTLLIDLIEKHGIICIYHYLNKAEKILYIEACARQLFINRFRQNRVGRYFINIYLFLKAKMGELKKGTRSPSRL